MPSSSGASVSSFVGPTAKRRAQIRAKQAHYELTPRGKFQTQRGAAKRRGIPWALTFDQWQHIWEVSGKWHLRGRGPGCYVMCRVGDTGPYSMDNVYIGTKAENDVPNLKVGIKRRHTVNSTTVTFEPLDTLP